MTTSVLYRDAVGLSLDADNAATPEQAQPRRDPAFREKVLLAYEYRCCVCGHDLRTCGHEWMETSGPRSRAHQVVPGPRAGRGAERPRAVLAAPQDLRPRRVHRAAGEPPDRVQPPPDGRRRHQSEAARPPRRRPDRAAGQGMPAASGVSGLAPGRSVQGAGAGVAGGGGVLSIAGLVSPVYATALE